MNERHAQPTRLPPEQLPRLFHEIHMPSGWTDGAVNLQIDMEMWPGGYAGEQEDEVQRFFDAYAEFAAIAATEELEFFDVENGVDA